MEKKTILIIDGEESVLSLLTKKLKKADYNIITAKNGRDGLNLARTSNPDLIILDIILPVIDGYKVCQMLKFDENYNNIPIILLSASSLPENQELGYKTGAELYIVKSSAIELFPELLENIKKLLLPK